jgi:hypothetical protein
MGSLRGLSSLIFETLWGDLDIAVRGPTAARPCLSRGRCISGDVEANECRKRGACGANPKQTAATYPVRPRGFCFSTDTATDFCRLGSIGGRSGRQSVISPAAYSFATTIRPNCGWSIHSSMPRSCICLSFATSIRSRTRVEGTSHVQRANALTARAADPAALPPVVWTSASVVAIQIEMAARSAVHCAL